MAAPMKLYFFNARARVELLRLILAHAKVEYEFVEVPLDNTWYEGQKKEVPFAKLPVLEFDGKMYGESIALAIYLAEKYDLHGSTDMERLIINELLCLKESLMEFEADVCHENDEKKKAEMAKDFYDVQYPRFMGYFSRFIEEYSQGKDFVLGDKLTAADLAIYTAVTTLAQDRPEVVSQYPLVAAHRKRVAEVDGIKQYLATSKILPI